MLQDIPIQTPALRGTRSCVLETERLALRKPTLADTVSAWREYAPRYLPLPHPSPRNQPWLARHRWFERDVLGALRARVRSLVA